MNKKLKKYIVGLNSQTFAVSFVENPAIEEELVYMSEQEQKMEVKLSSDEKHLVYGCILVPDKPIYRSKDDGTEFYIEFTKDSIEKMSQDFLKNNRQHSVTLQHMDEVGEITLVESWIKSSMTMDKSLAIGLSADLPIGSWIGGFKVNNLDVWNRIKSGELKGFSVESLLNLQSFDFSKDIEEMSIENYKENGLFDAMKTAFKEAMKEEKLSSEENPSEKEVKKELEKIDENITVAEVKLEEQTTTTTETKVEEPVVENPVVEEPKPVEEPKVETPVEEPKQEEHNPLADVVENLKTELESLRKMNEDLMAKVADLNKQPSAKPINTNTSGTNGGNTTFQNWRETMRRML